MKYMLVTLSLIFVSSFSHAKEKRLILKCSDLPSKYFPEGSYLEVYQGSNRKTLTNYLVTKDGKTTKYGSGYAKTLKEALSEVNYPFYIRYSKHKSHILNLQPIKKTKPTKHISWQFLLKTFPDNNIQTMKSRSLGVVDCKAYFYDESDVEDIHVVDSDRDKTVKDNLILDQNSNIDSNSKSIIIED